MKKRLLAIAFMTAFAAATATPGELGTGNRNCHQDPAVVQPAPCNNFDATSVTLTQIIAAICSIVP